ncbi:MAG: putative glycoside hydrolase [Polyangiales bacterium]
MRNPRRSLFIAASLFAPAACSHRAPPPPQVIAFVAPPTASAPEAPTPVASTPPPAPPTPRELLRAWLATKLPAGGRLVEKDDALAVEHVAAAKATIASIAASYLELTNAYASVNLENAILKANPVLRKGTVAEGTVVSIPEIVGEVPRAAADSRLGWPKERALRGIYIPIRFSTPERYVPLLDGAVAQGLNAVVVDAKDVVGVLNYPSQVPLAVELNMARFAAIPSLERLVRYTHSRGIRVIARLACFRDDYVAPRKPKLAVQAFKGGAHYGPKGYVDWLDPANDAVQGYLLAAIDEILAAGVDELQLDYVRYPTEGSGDADFHLRDRHLTTPGVITGWVHTVHERTKAAGVPLSLDVFGIVAWRAQADIDSTGQDLQKLGPEIEAISPMVYPSHFADGFAGFKVPGDHPEIVAMGTARVVAELKLGGAPDVIVRPWLQAFSYGTTSYGSRYVAQEMDAASTGGGVGWLAWNAAGEYGPTFAATGERRGGGPATVKGP